jgi:nitroreductase
MSDDNIFNRIPDLKYTEEVAPPNPEAFDKIVRSRRSVRVYDETPVPETVMNQVLEWSLLAPNSSNLQCWEFIWVRDPEKKKQLAKFCFNQPAARTARELVVIVARPTWWRKNAKLMIEEFNRQEAQGQEVPKAARHYYEKLVPYVYAQGPMSLFGWLKKLLIFFVGLFQLIPRQPTSHEQLKKWAVKSSALASQNFMLGMSAHGFDTCPMEGFDECRVKKLLGIGRKDEITMVISVGKRAASGVYGPRIRFPKEKFLSIV